MYFLHLPSGFQVTVIACRPWNLNACGVLRDKKVLSNVNGFSGTISKNVENSVEGSAISQCANALDFPPLIKKSAFFLSFSFFNPAM